MMDDRLIGMLVDAVSDIMTPQHNGIPPVPEIDASADQRYLSGLVQRGDQLVALLWLEELFDLGDLPSEMTFQS